MTACPEPVWSPGYVWACSCGHVYDHSGRREIGAQHADHRRRVIHTVTLDLPAGIWLTSNQRHHWAAKARRTASIRMLARHAARGIPVVERCRVTAAIGYPTASRADPSNASPTVKACLDGITDAGRWADDDSEHVISVTYVRGETTRKRGVYRVVIEIEEVAAP